ncbi:hypothetical protein, partial [Bacillus sp. CH140a_4T]
MKALFKITVVLIVTLLLIFLFPATINCIFGENTLKILMIIIYSFGVCIFIYIQKFSLWFVKFCLGIIYKKKQNKMTLFQWTGITRSVDAQIKKIIDNSIAKNDAIDNLTTIKNRIRLHFQDDIEKMKTFKLYLKVIVEDTTATTFKTFILGMLSSGFISLIVQNKLHMVFLMDVNLKKEVGETFYYTVGGIYTWIIISCIATWLLIISDRARERILIECIDMSINEVEK